MFTQNYSQWHVNYTIYPHQFCVFFVYFIFFKYILSQTCAAYSSIDTYNIQMIISEDWTHKSATREWAGFNGSDVWLRRAAVAGGGDRVIERLSYSEVVLYGHRRRYSYMRMIIITP